MVNAIGTICVCGIDVAHRVVVMTCTYSTTRKHNTSIARYLMTPSDTTNIHSTTITHSTIKTWHNYNMWHNKCAQCGSSV